MEIRPLTGKYSWTYFRKAGFLKGVFPYAPTGKPLHLNHANCDEKKQENIGVKRSADKGVQADVYREGNDHAL